MTTSLVPSLPWVFLIVGGIAMIVGGIMVVKCDRSWRSHVWYCTGCTHSWIGHAKKCARCNRKGKLEPGPHHPQPVKVTAESGDA